MEYFINPVPKPRMTRSDKWKKRRCVLAYRGFRDRVKDLKITLPERSKITFFIPMPGSWSKKKRNAHELKPHQTTPDIDNLLKGLLDALYDEDKHIWSLAAEKYWRSRPGILIEDLSQSNQRGTVQ